MAKEQDNTVKLDFEDWRYDEWTFELEGGEKYSIQNGGEGDPVPADKEKDVKKAAEEQGIKLRRAK